MGANLTTYEPVLKTLYDEPGVQVLTYKKRPLTGMLPKYTKFGGKNKQIPVDYGKPQNRSQDFSIANAGTTSTVFQDYLITRVQNHSIAKMDSQTVQATMYEGPHSFVKAMKHEIDGSFATLSDNLETDGFRAGFKTLGRVSTTATVTNKTIALADTSEIVNFEVGMTLRGSSTEGGSYDVGSEVLAGVDRSTGEITATSAAWNTVMTALAAGDYLQVSGDGANGGAAVGIQGLAAWILTGNPGSTLFNTVDRSADSRLYGAFWDGSDSLVEEALIDAQAEAARIHEAEIDCVILNHGQYRKLVKELGSKKDYVQALSTSSSGKAAVSYKGVIVHGMYGDVDVIPANKCQGSIGWGLNKDTWRFGSLGQLTRFDDTDGNTILRQPDASGVASRVVSWSQIWCKRPSENVQIALSPA